MRRSNLDPGLSAYGDCFAVLAMTTKVKAGTDMNPTRERAIAELRRMILDALGKHDAAVWLFGSCARGNVQRPDDTDIAIFPRGDFPSGFFAKFAADFEESAIPYDLDLLDLRGADPALLDEILWTGIRWRD